MYALIGLGNPGKEYKNTRHNVGYEMIDALARKYDVNVLGIKHKAMVGSTYIGGEKILFVKPLTYMNLSGESVKEVINYYKLDGKKDIIVISDDISLDVGRIRIRKKGSDGGHNGLKNIIHHLGHEEFMRIRVGVGEKPAGYDLADYVLGHFNKQEEIKLQQGMEQGMDAIKTIIDSGIDDAMNLYNRKQDKGQGDI